jgi:predicted amidophosphoribosyltransferase
MVEKMNKFNKICEKRGMVWLNFNRACPKCNSYIPKYKRICPGCGAYVKNVQGKVFTAK